GLRMGSPPEGWMKNSVVAAAEHTLCGEGGCQRQFPAGDQVNIMPMRLMLQVKKIICCLCSTATGIMGKRRKVGARFQGVDWFCLLVFMLKNT
ncbi:MAG TPA: hypothetical protein PKM23_14990, partial [bacterium]|nr:hypothetical protein [bacterium]